MLHNSLSQVRWLLVLLLLSACGDKDEKFDEMSVEQLYNMAMNQYDEKSFSKAAKIFDEVEKQHPYSNWALRAQLMAAYCYYQAKKYDEAEEGFKTFSQLHPSHQDVVYAKYMIGLCNYEQIPIVERDQESSRDALNAFQEVLNRFADSVYSKDAKFKMDLIRDHLAGKEMDTGRWYLTVKKQPLAALNRFKVVVDEYQTTSHAPEALYRMVECYLSMGIIEQAKATSAVLGHNYPDNKWYKSAYELMQNIKA